VEKGFFRISITLIELSLPPKSIAPKTVTYLISKTNPPKTE
jgi:hypothetical protein